MYPTLAIFAPPYTTLQPIDSAWTAPAQPAGETLVWRPEAAGIEAGEFDFVESRPRGYSLLIILPPPGEIGTIAKYLPRLSSLRPHAVLPAVGVLDQPYVMRTAMSIVPRSLPDLVSWYLDRHAIVTNLQARKEIRRIFELAPRVTTISKLCRIMYTSRRTLGRHFDMLGLPVPSHWLQFARMLNVILRAHSERTALSRLATQAGYPDGFTFSNQVKRLIDYRPSEIRGLYGFEWVLERWLRLESNHNLDAKAA